MSKVQVINLTKTHEKWVKLLLYFQNGLPGVYQIILPDAETATKTMKKLYAALGRHPSWFNLMISQRENLIYVIKTQFVQKVVLKDEDQ